MLLFRQNLCQRCQQFFRRVRFREKSRMELTVALEEWLARIPNFCLEEGRDVAWAGGQVRGPRKMPVSWPS